MKKELKRVWYHLFSDVKKEKWYAVKSESNDNFASSRKKARKRIVSNCRIFWREDCYTTAMFLLSFCGKDITIY